MDGHLTGSKIQVCSTHVHVVDAGDDSDHGLKGHIGCAQKKVEGISRQHSEISTHMQNEQDQCVYM